MVFGWLVGVAMVLAGVTASATTPADEQPVTDPEGKTLAVAVTCNTCQSPDNVAAKRCRSGVQTGWLNGKPCGPCLVKQNAGMPFEWPYDLHVTGTLTDEAGQPLKGEFVKLFLPVGWTVRTVTSEQGKFRLTVGATQQPRKTRKPLVTDLGTRVSSPQGKAGNYAIYLLPEAYKECSATDAPPIETPARTTRKRKGHPKSRAH